MKALAFSKVLSFWKVFGLLAIKRTNHNVLGLALTIVDDINHEDPIILPYCKPKNMQPMLNTTTYAQYQNLALKTLFLHDMFDSKFYLFWMGKLKVRLSKMNWMNIFKSFVFNCGCL